MFNWILVSYCDWLSLIVELLKKETSAGVKKPIETAKANGLNPRKCIQYILSDIPGSAIRQYSEFLEGYLPWNPIIQKLCR